MNSPAMPVLLWHQLCPLQGLGAQARGYISKLSAQRLPWAAGQECCVQALCTSSCCSAQPTAWLPSACMLQFPQPCVCHPDRVLVSPVVILPSLAVGESKLVELVQQASTADQVQSALDVMLWDKTIRMRMCQYKHLSPIVINALLKVGATQAGCMYGCPGAYGE